jgi:hypothetical protein
MAVGCGTAFNINDLVGQPELVGNDNRDSRERFIDLCALDGTNVPTGALQRLLDRWDRPQSEHAGLDRCDAVGDKARDWGKAAFLSPGFVRDDYGGGRVVEPWRITGGN